VDQTKFTHYIKFKYMLGLGNKSAIKDTPALKSKRYVNKYKWDPRANRGRGGFTKASKSRTDANYRK